jgi:hypothetical protein
MSAMGVLSLQSAINLYERRILPMNPACPVHVSSSLMRPGLTKRLGGGRGGVVWGSAVTESGRIWLISFESRGREMWGFELKIDARCIAKSVDTENIINYTTMHVFSPASFCATFCWRALERPPGSNPVLKCLLNTLVGYPPRLLRLITYLRNQLLDRPHTMARGDSRNRMVLPEASVGDATRRVPTGSPLGSSRAPTHNTDVRVVLALAGD